MTRSQGTQDAEFSGARLRELRTAAGLSRTELAAAIGRSYETVETWEQDLYEPSLRSIVALLRVLRCSLDDLMTNDAPHAGNGGASKTALGRTGRGSTA